MAIIGLLELHDRGFDLVLELLERETCSREILCDLRRGRRFLLGTEVVDRGLELGEAKLIIFINVI